MDFEQVGPWIDRQRARGATMLRIKTGGSRSLVSRGSVDVVEADGKTPRPVDDVVQELRDDLGNNGWPGTAETWGVDAIDPDGKVLKSAQGTEKDTGAAAARHTPATSASRTDFEVLVGALVESVRDSKELAKSAIAELGKERSERRAAEADALAAHQERIDAQATAAIEQAIAEIEQAGQTDEDAVKTRGVEAMEKMLGVFERKAGRKPTKEDIFRMVKDPANRDAIRAVANDPDFLDALQAAAAPDDAPAADPKPE